MTAQRPPITRAENVAKWLKNAAPTARRRILAEVALIEAMEAKRGTRYDAKPDGAK